MQLKKVVVVATAFFVYRCLAKLINGQIFSIYDISTPCGNKEGIIACIDFEDLSTNNFISRITF
jgi:hypothetical protein